MVLLALSDSDKAWMRVSTFKSEAMDLCWKPVDRSLWDAERCCPKQRTLSILGSCSRVTRKWKVRWTGGTTSAEMWALYQTIMVRKVLSWKVNLLIYQSIYVPTLNYSYKLWVVAERMKSQAQAAEMSFLHRVDRLSLRHRVRSLDIQRKPE